ncbi:MAG: diguanylate cyclase [Halanaerobacter sp.]
MINILIVDDQEEICLLLGHILRKAGYENIESSATAEETFKIVADKLEADEDIDLILLDINLPDKNGIEVCKELKSKEQLKDTPIIMVTGDEDNTTLEKAFSAGAVDYITKPISKIELRARVGSALQLRKEIKERNAREKELEETAHKLKKANKKLEEMASKDGLTGLTNRRLFDRLVREEWQRARRNNDYLGLIMLDIDHFKEYNDFYGHQKGDDCLKKLAHTMQEVIKRPGDLVARYGGEEFVVVLPQTDLSGTKMIAEKIRQEIVNLKIPHHESKVSDYVTVSLGVAVAQPNSKENRVKKLIEVADNLLYEAKEKGRNRTAVEEKIIN